MSTASSSRTYRPGWRVCEAIQRCVAGLPHPVPWAVVILILLFQNYDTVGWTVTLGR